MDFSFRLDADDGKRQAFRAHVPGLACQVEGRDLEFKVKDLSAGGLALIDEEHVFVEQEVVYVGLLINRRVYLHGLKAKVVRILVNGIVGLNFLDLDRRQEASLDKLVLEVQKRLINLRKIKTSTEQP